MIPWKQLHHLCKGVIDDGMKIKYPSPDMQAWKQLYNICICINVLKTMEIPPEILPLKTINPSQEMIPRKQLNHLCKGARNDGFKTIYPSPDTRAWKKLITWKPCINLQIWYPEKSCSNLVKTRAMMAWKLFTVIVTVSNSRYGNLKKSAPSLLRCQRWWLDNYVSPEIHLPSP